MSAVWVASPPIPWGVFSTPIENAKSFKNWFFFSFCLPHHLKKGCISHLSFPPLYEPWVLVPGLSHKSSFTSWVEYNFTGISFWNDLISSRGYEQTSGLSIHTQSQGERRPSSLKQRMWLGLTAKPTSCSWILSCPQSPVCLQTEAWAQNSHHFKPLCMVWGETQESIWANRPCLIDTPCVPREGSGSGNTSRND